MITTEYTWSPSVLMFLPGMMEYSRLHSTAGTLWDLSHAQKEVGLMQVIRWDRWSHFSHLGKFPSGKVP